MYLYMARHVFPSLSIIMIVITLVKMYIHIYYFFLFFSHKGIDACIFPCLGKCRLKQIITLFTYRNGGKRIFLKLALV